MLSGYGSHHASNGTLDDLPAAAAIAAVNIARPAGILSTLFLVLYHACMVEERVLDGYTRRDGSIEHLALEDLQVRTRTRRALAHEKAALVRTAFALEVAFQDTTDRGMCARGRNDLFDHVDYYVRGECDVLYRYG
ncbi:hypothetical protein V8D89_006692 [Ganoderma adspersum]